MQPTGDVAILRDLARQYMELCHKPIYDERRELWRRHNSLERTRPLLYCRWLAAWHEADESRLSCEDPFFRNHEAFFRQMIFQDTIGDDYILEPWITQPAARYSPPEGVWGVRYGSVPTTEKGGAWKNDPPLKSLDDIDRLVTPRHEVDEEATERAVSRLHEAIGDLIPIEVDRSPLYRVWHADLSTDLGYLRGIDRFMWDMSDNPQWLHRLLAFMRDGVLATHEQAETNGDWRLSNHENQAMPYSRDLADPAAREPAVRRKDLWCFCAAQEFTLVSPAMHDEFMLQYQLPIIEKFGLCAYGCCEDLTRKIDILRKIPNLRRFSVVPRADVRKSAEAIGTDYVLSWRPNPAEMVCCGFDEGHIRKVIRDAMEAARGCHIDITLKDVQTVQGDTSRLSRWVRIVREVSDDYV